MRAPYARCRCVASAGASCAPAKRVCLWWSPFERIRRGGCTKRRWTRQARAAGSRVAGDGSNRQAGRPRTEDLVQKVHTEDICCILGYGSPGRVPVHGARWWRAQIPNNTAAMPPRSRSATRQRLQLLLGDDLMVLFAAACAGRSRRLHTLSARFAVVSALI